MSGLTFSNANFEGNKIQVDTPGIYEAKLTGIEVKDITDREGNVKFPHVIQFEFELSNSNNYTETVFMPKEVELTTPVGKYTEAQQKTIGNVFNKLGHILKNFVAPETFVFEKLGENETWPDFVAKYKNAFEKALEVAPKTPVWLKIAGSVYQGKARLGFTAYLGFISNNPEGVKFSPKEAESNAEYHQFLANKAAMAADPMGMPLPGGGDAPAGMSFSGQEAPF